MATRTCLTSLPAHPLPTPPYAKLDTLELDEAQIVSGNSFPVDVLVNDHDANCDPIFIGGVDSVSQKGGTVALSLGTGTNGYDEVIYTPPPTGFAGNDRFEYTVSDGVLTSTTRVEINVQRPKIVAHWPLDELSGTTAANLVPGSSVGALTGGADFGANSVPAMYTAGLDFDGVDDAIEVAALHLNTNAITMTAWVRRDGPQNDWAPIAFCRGNTTAAGFGFGTTEQLRYHWDGGQFNWNSSLTVPDGVWSFVALVVTPTSARIHMQPGITAPMQMAVNSTAHAVEAFDATLHLGRDPSSATRFFAGALDDVRIYRRALTPTEVSQVAAGGRADAPAPAHLDNETPTHPVVAWVPGFDAVQHDFYFGGDALAVGAASSESPEYRGRHNELGVHSLPLLPQQLTRNWRVDTVLSDGSVLPGEVWTFTTGVQDYTDGLVVHYTFDIADSSGNLVLDQSPNPPAANGTRLNGAALAPGHINEAAELDGINDMVQSAPLLLNTDRVTISAWVRRDGPQTGTNGIVFWRGGSTTAGLNLGSNHELRYHWNGENWWWDSGLELPDGVWSHVVLIVEPSRATIYLNGQSAVHNAAHPPEPFDTNMVIGRDPGFTNRNFGGAIDELGIWSRALSPGEVLGLYGAGRVGRTIQGDSDLSPPTPDALTWEVEPTPSGANSIAMRATTATDPSSVEYSFVCTAGPGNDSGWQQSPYYNDTGLPNGATCTYVATARDASPNQNAGGSTSAKTASLAPEFVRGDANIDGSVDVADAIAILTYLFGGGATSCLAANDTNDSGAVNIADAISLLDYLFGGSSAPLPPPFPDCGINTAGSSIACDSYSGC